MIKIKSNQWKSISVPHTTLNNNYTNLVSIEEINDYDNIEEGRENNHTVKQKQTLLNETIKRKSEQISKNSKKPKIILQNNTKRGKPKLTKSLKKCMQKLKHGKLNAKSRTLCDISHSDGVIDEQMLVNMDNWKNFCIPDSILKALFDKEFNSPTEIQALCLPEAMFKKKDVFGAAETGSGKTLAFGIPILSAIVENIDKSKEETDENKLWALIVAPTRELVIQVKSHLQDMCKYIDIQILDIIGGMSIEKQVRKLSKCPHIVVGTPGRLWQLIRDGNEFLSSSVDYIKFLVIDEADRMMEKLHFLELQCLLERLNQNRKGHRQTFIFSATLSLVHEPPSYVTKKRKKKQQLRISPDEKLRSFITLVGANNPSIIDVTKKNVVPDTLQELCVNCTLDEKDYYILYIVRKQPGRKIIFCNSINSLRRLGELLTTLEIKPLLLFSHMDQKRRLNNLERFRNDENRVLLATDVAARGLDIPQVECVLHYHVPKTSEIYVHRSGRTARGTNAGITIILSSPAEAYHFNKMRSTLGKGDFASYKVDSSHIFNAFKKQVALARDIIKLQTKLKSEIDNANWLEKCAEEMDLILDEDDLPEKMDTAKQKQYKQQIKTMTAQLKKLMARPILPYHISPRFPTYNAV